MPSNRDSDASRRCRERRGRVLARASSEARRSFRPAFRGLLALAATAGVLGTTGAATASRGPLTRLATLMQARQNPAEALESLARAHPALARVHRPLADDPGFVILELGSGEADLRHARPGLLVVAGLDGRHRVSSAAAVRIAESLLSEPSALDSATVYVVARMVEPETATGRVAIPHDADRDGRDDEDGPRDLDGDGVVRMMRLAEPSPILGLAATHVVDEQDPRLMRPARPGERATHALLPESIDADGDGRFGEDGPGGTDANADWPAHWPEFSDAVAGWPLSLPRTRALADWILSTDHLAATLILGPGDGLSAVPVTRGGGPTGRVPEGILEADERAHEAVATRFRERTGIAAGPRATRVAGSLDAWAYAHLGLWSFSTPLWDRPDRLGDLATGGVTVTATDDSGTPGDAREARSRSRRDAGEDPFAADRAWLTWIDEHRGGRGFADWTPMEHPELGRVEIGGFDPMLLADAPADLVPALAEAAAGFTRDLLAMLPRLEITSADLQHRDGDVYELAVTIANSGSLPTRPAMAERAARLTPTLLQPEVAAEAILSGPVPARFERIDGGDRRSVRWMLRMPESGVIRILLTDPIHGRRTLEVAARQEP